MVPGRSASGPLQSSCLPLSTELGDILLMSPMPKALPPRYEDKNKTLRFMKESLVELRVVQEWDRLREITPNLMFYGPPGTGKSHIAQAYARYITGCDSDAERIFFVQFHPAYGYADFVEGYKPEPSQDGRAQYKKQPGPFLKAKKTAVDNATQQVVLIIDEINRCQLSKVFGDYVDSLPYRHDADRFHDDDDRLKLPRNLWILGTMNVSDRSLVRVETELRKGFAFVQVHPGVEGSAFRDVVQRKFRKDSLSPAKDCKGRDQTTTGLVELGEIADKMLSKANEKLSNAGYDAYIGPSHVFGAKCKGSLQVCSLLSVNKCLPVGRVRRQKVNWATPARGVAS